MLNLSLGEKIMVLRKQRKVSQKDLAKTLGINPSNLPNYESGRYSPSLDMLVKISDFFDVSLDSLVRNRASDDLLKLQDHDLIRITKQVDELDPKDRETIKAMIQSFVNQQKKSP